jgi:DNA-binding transcriptional regulator LsrR (DeoR family)
VSKASHPRSREVIVKAARMYYLDGRAQDDIARVLGTSRSNVSRMLSAARDEGIVEIRVLDPLGRDAVLEDALRERFDLTDVRVAAFHRGMDAPATVGDLAAVWLDEALRDGQVLALSWGTSLQAVVAAVSVDQPRSVELVPLVGGLPAVETLVTGQELVRELANRLGASYHYLHGPALLHSETARDALVGEPSISEALTRARSADIAMVGIGTVGVGSSNQIIEGLGLTPEERKVFLAQSPVGDICCRFFDAEGQAIHGVVHDRVLAVELDELRQIPTVIGVATGAEKAPGVLGALRGRLINGLITDASLAHCVLSADRHDG